MLVKLRLTRGGRKKRPFYRIVAADSKFQRDGRFLEKVGTYSPLETVDKQITLKEERVLYWLKEGAQPTDTTRNILSTQGIMLKFDLIKKGKAESEVDTLVSKYREEKLKSLLQKEEKEQNKRAKKVMTQQREERKKEESQVEVKDVKSAKITEEENKKEKVEETASSETKLEEDDSGKSQKVKAAEVLEKENKEEKKEDNKTEKDT